MENLTSPQASENMLVIDEANRAFLIESSKWAKFLAIVGYIGMGLLVLLGLALLFGMTIVKELTDLPFNPGIFGIIYFIIAVVYYFPITYLYNFSQKIRDGLVAGNQQTMTAGFGNLKSMFKFIGILMIVALSLYALVLLIAVPVAIIAAVAP
ncbi:MAG: DUF5362 family protein [Bacteroidales bacterium]|jgi:hypothetical protein|nr:DUF5362 family protein [Bacteroidales bacterium]